jgi:hypothetical protein
MTRFADQLFDDLMQEHESTLARTRPSAPRRHFATRRTLLAAGAACAAGAAAAGVLVAGGGTPAYAVTANPDGTVTVAVHRDSGVAGANARLAQLGDGQVVVVPFGTNCPSPNPPAVREPPTISVASRVSATGSVTVDAKGIPARDILVVAFETSGRTRLGLLTLASPPAPSCLNLPSGAVPPAGGPGAGTGGGSGGGQAASSNGSVSSNG